MRQHASACVSMRQHASACVSMRQHASACVSIRLHTPAYACIRLQQWWVWVSDLAVYTSGGSDFSIEDGLLGWSAYHAWSTHVRRLHCWCLSVVAGGHGSHDKRKSSQTCLGTSIRSTCVFSRVFSPMLFLSSNLCSLWLLTQHGCLAPKGDYHG
jgi:hypothetical protein